MAQKQQQQQSPHKPIEEMMRNLKVDPSLELSESNTVPSKDRSPSPSDATSCISSAGDVTGSVKEDDVSDHDPLATDQALPYPAGNYYHGYYYPGYDANDQVYYVAGDGTELQYPVMQADNGSLIYFTRGIHHNYSSYGPYVSMIGIDGQCVAQSPYSPSSMYQPSIPSPGYIPTPIAYGESLPHLWDPSVFAGDGTLGNYGYSGVLKIPRTKPNRSSPSNPRGPQSKKALPSNLSKSLETKTSIPALDVSPGHGMHNQLKLPGKVSQHASPFQSDVLGKGYFPFSKFPSYNPEKGVMLYPNNTIKANARGWGSNEKVKTRSKMNGINDALLNEQNHGPRTTNAKGSVAFGGNAAESLAPDGNENSNSITSAISRDQYNHTDFPTSYDHAFFFVIKSYSEDDIHKSIKYNVWASTPNGNKRLDNAYIDSHLKIAEKGCSCPVFLFFSVNASGQFCGVAEMIGRVDFNKSMDFWQQDKWNGCFPVKWHIIKDVPNLHLRHIILENNENKPVTNSRDTQEVKFPQGIEILNIFKNHVSKTSILDDFDFYESRQKMHEKRPRPLISHFDHKQKTNELITGFQSVDLSATKNNVDTRVGDSRTE